MLQIQPGTKLRMALDVPIGQEPSFSLVCTFVKPLDSASFLISIPMKDGKPLPLDETQKLLICFGVGSEMQIVAGVQFRFADNEERQQMQDYVLNIKKRYKL